MIAHSAKDSTGTKGKVDLASAGTRTWVLDLRGRRAVGFLLKNDTHTSTGLSALSIKSQGHADSDKATITPVTPAVAQTFNAHLVGGLHGAAFTQNVVEADGYFCMIVPPTIAQSATAPVTAICDGYCCSFIEIIATAGGGTTVLGLELIVFESFDSQGGAIGLSK